MSRGATHASRDTLLYIVSCTSVSGLVDTRTTVNGDAQDALALLQIVEARVYQTVAVKELEEHPKAGLDHPELLKGQPEGRWSREFSKKHRLVYRIYDTEVVVLVISA